MNTLNLASADVIGYKEGVRAFLVKSFAYMAAGLLLTALSSYIGAANMTVVDGKPVAGITHLISMGVTLVLVMATGVVAQVARSAFWAIALFVAYAAFTGYGLSSLSLTYTGQSLITTFLAAACVFGGAAVYGSVTKRDLTALRMFFTCALFGLLGVAIINIFIGSALMEILISGAGVLLFAGLTAYDMQTLEQMYNQRNAKSSEGLAVLGGLTLYLDFLNLFLFLLRFVGVKKD